MTKLYNLAGIVTVSFAAGALAIAVMDSSSRSDYYDLAKIALGGYLGYVTPRASKD